MELPEYRSIEEKYKVFDIHYARIDNVRDFQLWYNDTKKQQYFFRGQKEACYKNFTSAQRICITHDLNCLPITLVYKQVKSLKKSGDDLLRKYCKSTGISYSDFFIMSYAQHYASGISPLLDITKDIDTSLYFMCQAQFPVKGAASNSLSNYSSIYYIKPSSVKSFDDIIENILSKTQIVQRNINEADFQKLCKNEIQKLFDVRVFNIIGGYYPFVIENKPHYYSFSNGKYTYQSVVVVGNMNVTAQDGCFIYYDNEREPYETKDMMCVDIHKSLIPYITQNILIPNKKTKEYLYPNVANIVDESFEKMLADKDVLR